MIEIYEVRHCEKKKEFSEKSKALQHADALEKLGYSVEVYLIEKGIYTEIKVLLYMSDKKQMDRLFLDSIKSK